MLLQCLLSLLLSIDCYPISYQSRSWNSDCTILWVIKPTNQLSPSSRFQVPHNLELEGMIYMMIQVSSFCRFMFIREWSVCWRNLNSWLLFFRKICRGFEKTATREIWARTGQDTSLVRRSIWCRGPESDCRGNQVNMQNTVYMYSI